MQSVNLKGKTLMVTGGTKGIGGAITRTLLSNQANVIAVYARDRAAAQTLEEQQQSGWGELTLCRADLTRDTGIDKIVQTVGEQSLDGLVHSAATGIHKPMAELSARHWDWTMDTNVKSLFVLLQRLRERLSVGASLVGLSSEGAQRAFHNYLLVGTSKAALEGLSRYLALELAHLNVRSNIVSAGSVVTAAWDAFPDKEEKVARLQAKFAGTELLGLQDIANVVAFLCSDQSVGINAQTIVVDKGERVFGDSLAADPG